jgi:hypothetical protein
VAVTEQNGLYAQNDSYEEKRIMGADNWNSPEMMPLIGAA